MAKTRAGIRLLALDGNDTVGGTKYLLRFDDRAVMLDFGTNYAKQSIYYEELLKPRTAAGIFDLVAMGILPDARGLYRDDVHLPDLELRGPEVGPIDSVLVTHAHLDHAGAVGLLRPDIPLITSAMTATTLKAMRAYLDEGATPTSDSTANKGLFGHHGLRVPANVDLRL